jgi:hypothetical protein
MKLGVLLLLERLRLVSLGALLETMSRL